MARKTPTRREKALATASKLYKERAVKLRKFGFEVKYGTKRRGAQKPSAKSEVTRTWEKVKHYVENTKQKFVFRKVSGKKKKILQAGLSDKQFTPSGYFLRVPKGAKRAPRTKIDTKRDVVTYQYEGKKGGRLTEEIHRIDPELLLEDPPRVILAMGRKKDRVVLTVNGFDSSTTREYSLDNLAFYIAEDLLPKFLDPNVDAEYTRRHGKGSRDENDFVDIFHIKLLRHEKSNKKRKRKNKVTKRKTKRRGK